VDEFRIDELETLVRKGNFPGRTQLLSWLAEHPRAQAHRARIPEHQFTNARDARKIWEIRYRTTLTAGATTAHMDEAIDALKNLEFAAPSTPVVLTSVEDTDRTWMVLSANGRVLAAFWVERRPVPGR
jgi:hypothetical protein